MLRTSRILFLVLMITLMSNSQCSVINFLQTADLKISSTRLSEGEYFFNPKTILIEIADGNHSVFSAVDTLHAEVDPDDATPIEWSQDDYLAIAAAFHLFKWNASINNWNLHQITFTLGCQEISFGTQFVSVELFRILTIEEREIRHILNIYIDPHTGKVSWLEYQETPNIHPLTSTGLDIIELKVEDALTAAEENGGKEFREDVNNACVINLSLRGFEDEPYWSVSYAPDESNRIIYPHFRCNNKIALKFYDACTLRYRS